MMSDCAKCWSTPCTCGHEYRNGSIEWLRSMEQMFHKLIEEKEKQESSKSMWKRTFGGPPTSAENAKKDST